MWSAIAAGFVASGVALAGDPRSAAPAISPSPIGAGVWIGVSLQEVPCEATDAGTQGACGVRVRHVLRNSPAQRGGIHDGDWLVSLEGQHFERPDQVTAAISRRAAGVPLKVSVARDGKVVPITMVPEVRPSPERALRDDVIGTFAPAWSTLEPVRGTVPDSPGRLRGRVVVIDFWASWCAPCRIISPVLSQWQQRYGAQGLTVVGLTTDSPEVAGASAARTGIQYAVGVDVEGATSRNYGVSSLPTLFLLDKRGVVREVVIGYEPGFEARLSRQIEALLAEPTP